MVTRVSHRCVDTCPRSNNPSPCLCLSVICLSLPLPLCICLCLSLCLPLRLSLSPHVPSHLHECHQANTGRLTTRSRWQASIAFLPANTSTRLVVSGRAGLEPSSFLRLCCTGLTNPLPPHLAPAAAPAAARRNPGFVGERARFTTSRSSQFPSPANPFRSLRVPLRLRSPPGLAPASERWQPLFKWPP